MSLNKADHKLYLRRQNIVSRCLPGSAVVNFSRTPQACRLLLLIRRRSPVSASEFRDSSTPVGNAPRSVLAALVACHWMRQPSSLTHILRLLASPKITYRRGHAFREQVLGHMAEKMSRMPMLCGGESGGRGSDARSARH